MPVLHADMTERPAWCELEHFEIVGLAAGDKRRWQARHPANKLVVVEGNCRVGDTDLDTGASVDKGPGEHLVVAGGAAIVVELGGHWGADCGGAGIFGVATADELGDAGDAVDYPKQTNFDRHYHDCDEYWILVTGSGTASSENVSYRVGPGDCVATRMGHHHDFPLVDEPVRAVFFETTMRGAKRRGHLWEHTHGPAEPVEGTNR